MILNNSQNGNSISNQEMVIQQINDNEKIAAIFSRVYSVLIKRISYDFENIEVENFSFDIYEILTAAYQECKATQDFEELCAKVFKSLYDQLTWRIKNKMSSKSNKTQKRTISYDEILALTNDIEIACYQTNEFVKDSSKYDDQKKLLKKYIAKIEDEKVVKIINLRLEGYDWNHIAYIVKINVTACNKMYAKFIEDTKQNIARTARRKFLLN